MKRLIIFAILVFVLCLPLAVFLVLKSKIPAPRLLTIGSKAPAFEFITLQGDIYDGDSTTGKMILLLFFKTDCVYCLNELASLNRLSEDLSNRLQILAVSESDLKSTKDFINNHQIKIPILLDYKAIFRKRFKGNYVPTFYLLDEYMTIIFRKIGFQGFVEDEKMIIQLVGTGIKEEAIQF